MPTRFSLISCARRVYVRVALVAVLLTLSVLTTAGAVAQAAPLLSAAEFLKPDGTLDTSRGVNGALDLRGWNITLDSARGPILSPSASVPAAPNAPAWSALTHNGLDYEVRALAVMDSDLYVGGLFTKTNDGGVTNLNGIAKYSGGAWSALAHNGLDKRVFAFAVSGSDLYVGGNFTQTNDGVVTNLNNIAKYDTSSGAWSALANYGLNDSVYALAVMGSDLYVGGIFTKTADGVVTNLNSIAKYSSSAWSAFAHNGLNNDVYAFAVMGSDLYIGGAFTQTNDGAVTNLNNIAKYDTSGGAWAALAHNGLNSIVVSLALMGSDLYVGGSFSQTDDSAVTGLNYIAKYNTSGSAWAALAHNGFATKGFGSTVYAIVVMGSDLYVGGDFAQTADGAVTGLNYIAKYDTSSGTWSALPNNGLDLDATALAVMGSDLYVGGAFTKTNDSAVTNLNNIAKFGESDSCIAKPAKSTLTAPAHNGSVTKTKVKLKWNDVTCETEYRVTVKNAATNKNAFKTTLGADVTQVKTTALAKGQTYKWFVQACNAVGCAKSAKRTFKIP